MSLSYTKSRENSNKDAGVTARRDGLPDRPVGAVVGVLVDCEDWPPITFLKTGPKVKGIGSPIVADAKRESWSATGWQ